MLKLDFRNFKRVFVRDLFNRLAYGESAPRSCQLVFVDPSRVSRVIVKGEVKGKDSGRVIGGDWDLKTYDIKDSEKYKICYDRFVNGKSWGEAGAYELMMNLINNKPGVDGCYTYDDIVRRYEKLDRLYDWVSENKILLSRKQIDPSNFREKGGIYLHIDRNGVPVFAGAGWHRLLIAKILDIDVLPAQLGVVHKEAVENWRSCLIKTNS